ncbi:MAG: hypothetical protein Q9163_005501 [Psora crenata]
MASKQSSRERFPELYVPVSSHTDPHTRTRTVPMRVLCLGMPRADAYTFNRTGTAAMQKALESLGYKDCYHMFGVVANPPDIDMWHEAANAKYHGEGKEFEKADWDRLLGNCQAVCDLPAIAFSQELIQAYPDAKVILTIRDEDSWYDSMMKTVVPLAEPSTLSTLAPLDHVLLKKWFPMHRCVFAGVFENKRFERIGKRKFVEHYDMVRRLVPKERLLEYRVGDGWEKLCKFLEVPVPDYPFPVTNDTAAFGERGRVMVALAIRRLAMRLLPFMGAIVAVVFGIWIYSR